MEKNLKKGFTLIELLVVIAIIGILSSVVIVSLNNARSKARDSARKSNAQAMTTAFALHASEQSGEVAPAEVGTGVTINGWSTDGTAGNGIGAPDLTNGSPALSIYLKTLPVDGTANTYSYGNAGADATFILCVRQENNNNAGGTMFVCNSGGCQDSSNSAPAGAWTAANCTPEA